MTIIRMSTRTMQRTTRAMTNIQRNMPTMRTEDHEDHEDHDEDHTSASDHQAHEHHDHDDDGDASDADSHSDVSASYTFECESNEALTRIVFNRDGLPLGLERIDVLWVADWGQGAGQATPQSPSVNLQN